MKKTNKKVKRVMILADSVKEKTQKYIHWLTARLEEKGITIDLDSGYVDLILVLGGDGWMLRCINRYHWAGKPFLGLNFGGRGFLLNDLRENVVDLIAQGKFKAFEFPLLYVGAKTKDGILCENLSANDIYAERLTPRSCKLNIFINGKEAGREIEGDGLVVCTALGSAAYNLSAGGPAVHPLTQVICIGALNEIWPKRFPPLVFPWEVTVEIRVVNFEKGKVRITSGELFSCEDITEATIKKSKYRFSLVLLGGEDFTKGLFRKIMKVREVRNANY